MSFPIEGADYYIYMMELPPHIYAYVRLNSDATYSVYLDPRRDWLSQIDDWEHELWHILRDDLYSDRVIWEIESA